MSIFSDDKFLNFIHKIENFVAKILAIALVIVILIALFDLMLVLAKDLFSLNAVGFLNQTLIKIFGLFLNILIALELLENVTSYFSKHVIQVELVVVTALIAVARKIIIFDPDQFAKNDMIALAVACLALSISYWCLRRTSGTRKD